VKVLDFGLAKFAPLPAPPGTSPPTAVTLTKPGAVLGTLGYMSPEQVRGESVGAPSDLFSFGCVLYEMVTEQRAFVRSTAAETAAAILTEEPPKASSVSRDAPPELDRIISRCLAKRPEQRFRSAADVAFALRSLPNYSAVETQPMPPVVKPGARRAWWLAAAALALLSGALPYLPLRREAERRPISSLAVLPLVNPSRSPNLEHICTGVAESLTNNFSQLARLRVPAATVVANAVQNRPSGPREVGRALGADAVLAGKVEELGETLVIHAELIYVADGSQLWGERYTRGKDSLVSLPGEIARDIFAQAKVRLWAASPPPLTLGMTENPRALENFWQGRQQLSRRTEEGIRRGIDYLLQATAIDRDFARAHASLAEAYILAADAVLPSDTAIPQAERAARQALGLEDRLAEAHTCLAAANMLYHRRWAEAERGFERAIELNPNDPTAHQWYAEYLTAMGRHEEALREIRLAEQMDQLSTVIKRGVARHYYCAERYDEAVQQCRALLDSRLGNLIQTRVLLGRVYVEQGNFAQAVAELREADTLSPNPRVKSFLAYAYARAGRREEARRLLTEASAPSPRGYTTPLYLAAVYGALGEKEQAFALLHKAYQENSGLLAYLRVEPSLKSLRSDLRFGELARRLKLPE
jgi:eukaryotic-like serine/threonine-protein kinase